jgi:uncharacterized protein (TIGR02246 family)
VNDEEHIRRTLYLYAQRHDDRDAAGYVALFAEQGSFGSGAAKHTGRPAIRKFIDELYAKQPADRKSKHYFGNSVVEVDRDVAEAVTDVVVYESFGDDGEWKLAQVNRHYDRLIQQEGTWLFLEKRVEQR